MCLAIPGRIVAVDRAEPSLPKAEVDYGDRRRTAQLVYVPEAEVGDYVIVQAGFAVRIVSAAEAEESLRTVGELARAAAAATPSGPAGPPVGRAAFTKGG